jgi:hypothetical protein
MSPFAKLFDLPTHQVLFYKDFQLLDSRRKGMYTSYRIVAITQHEGAAQQLGYGYDSESKRDEVFEKLNEQFAKSTLSVVLEAFNPA